MTARTYDANGFFEVAGNPISRVGVFPYSGAQIGASEPDRIYQVYRPAEELSDPEAMDSFRLLPLIDDHTMLGDDYTSAEDKGVGGVIGEQITFDDGVLRANLKIFGSDLAEKLKKGKTELSCGYWCVYDFTPGTFDGKRYDAVQRKIRGNHLALVDEGRMGPDVAVLDRMCFTADAMEVLPVDEELKKLLADLTARVAKLEAGEVGETDETEVPAEIEKTGDEEDPEAEAAAAGDEEAEEAAADEDGEKPAAGMDAALKAIRTLTKRIDTLSKRPVMDEKALVQTVAKKTALAERLSHHVGVFDHSGMTYADVVQYGVAKLGVKVAQKGAEAVALDAYLQARQPSRPFTAQDSAPTTLGKALSAYVEGK